MQAAYARIQAHAQQPRNRITARRGAVYGNGDRRTYLALGFSGLLTMKLRRFVEVERFYWEFVLLSDCG